MFDKPDVVSERSRLTDNYPDAFTDTYGTVSGAPFIYKTGPAWPKRERGLEAQPYIREIRPVHNHPITSSWPKILRDTEAYLEDRGVKFTAITGFGFANARDKTPFCPLLVTIGVAPRTVAFEEAKAAAEHVKGTILGQAGFHDIEVAIREWTTSLSGSGPKLPSLHPLVDGRTTEFRHPFASTLDLYIAPLKMPYYEGTVGLYLRRSNDSDDILALTAAHVARPPPMHPNTGLTHKGSSQHRDEIIALGSKAYEDATTNIISRSGTLHKTNASLEEKISRLERLQAEGRGDAETVASALLRQDVVRATRNIKRLDRLHGEVTKFLTMPKQRRIGFVLHADPIGVSSSEPDGYTIDWAVIQLNKDAFYLGEFKGNKVYIGGKIKEEEYRDLMFPNHTDRAGYEYPKDGLLQIYGVMPESEIHQPTQLNANGDNAMPVIKNGMTTGATVGWVNGLKSLVRHHYIDCGLEFTASRPRLCPTVKGVAPFLAKATLVLSSLTEKAVLLLCSLGVAARLMRPMSPLGLRGMSLSRTSRRPCLAASSTRKSLTMIRLVRVCQGPGCTLHRLVLALRVSTLMYVY
ncbi:unnamed protein product [Cyclocybe aegerita]|uniref:Uncharacterized protein n=1 Tax=Cyclocybe aegerita TaxID=1973307 RepID=A0A8S0XRN3_CYCAE|nr:unnamed protein product [Cyclocybe aegerita]